MFDTEALLLHCVGLIAQGHDLPSYQDSVRHAADQLLPAPDDGALRDDPEVRQRLLLTIARGLWKIAPHPAHRFAPAPLPMPGRNDPCYCGSSRKFKHCCQPLVSGLPLDNVDLLGALLEAMPDARWSELVGSRIDVQMLAHTAQTWLEEGQPERARQLLAPWFVDGVALGPQHEAIFDLLLDSYTELDAPQQKQALLDFGKHSRERALRAAAWQREATMLADLDDFGAAWRSFAQAQRENPQAIALSHLEVAILIAEGREDDARVRAAYWAAKLARLRDPSLDGLIDLLRGVAEHGGDFMTPHDDFDDSDDLESDHDLMVDQLLDLLVRLPAPTASYRVRREGSAIGCLQPVAALNKRLPEWDDAFLPLPGDADDDDGPWLYADTWLSVLRSHPQLFDSFEVLCGLLQALDRLPPSDREDAVRRQLLTRSEALLRRVLKGEPAGLRLEWGLIANRRALALIALLVETSADLSAHPDNIARAEWLLALNPTDDTTTRITLMRHYLEARRFDDACRLAECFADDRATMRYNHALALYAAGQHERAATQLAEAVRAFPELMSCLLADEATVPASLPTAGANDSEIEGWWYRDEFLPLWQALDALPWAERHAR